MIEYLRDVAPMSNNEKEVLVKKICDYLIENKLQDSTLIYYNNIALKWDCSLQKYTVIKKDVKATDCFKYAINEHICMTFEGSLYQLINSCEDIEKLNQFDEFIESLGLSYELGNLWNMVIYKK